MTKSDKDSLKNELKKLFPDIKEFNEIVEQLEVNVVDNKTDYEVKQVNIHELADIKRAALSRDGKFEKFTSNESKEYVEVLNEVKGKLTSLDKKMDKVIQYMEAKRK